MNLFVKAAVIAAALGASAAASADTFDFSYTFTDGQEIIVPSPASPPTADSPRPTSATSRFR